MNNPFMNNSTPQTPAAGVPMPGAANGMNAGFEVDLTNVQEPSFAIPNGTYKAKCINVTQDVSKSGNPMFIWEFEIAEGNYKGKTFKSWTAITPAAMWKVAETVIALGVGQTGQVVKFKKGDVVGKFCGLVMEQDEYNGKATSKVVRAISLAEMEDAAKAALPTPDSNIPF